MQTYPCSEECRGEEVVVTEVGVERPECEEESGEFEDAAGCEERGEGVWDYEKG